MTNPKTDLSARWGGEAGNELHSTLCIPNFMAHATRFLNGNLIACTIKIDLVIYVGMCAYSYMPSDFVFYFLEYCYMNERNAWNGVSFDTSSLGGYYLLFMFQRFFLLS